MEKWEEQFKVISIQNYQMRLNALQKKNAQYQPSFGRPVPHNSNLDSTDDTKNIENLKNNSEIIENEVESSKITEQKKRFKIEEDYDMMDDFEDYEEEEEEVAIIAEIENEEDFEEENIDFKITQMKTKLKEKTFRITELKESLGLSKHKPIEPIKKNSHDNIEDLLENFSSSDLPELSDTNENLIKEDDDEENKEETIVYNPQYYKIKDRIKLLKHRCEAGLGNAISQKAYQYLKENINNTTNEEIRKELCGNYLNLIIQDIMGEDNIGFWHLIDQILFFEGLLNEFQEKK